MTEKIKNLNGHRVCDYSSDHKEVIIKDGNCLTVITAAPDGTLKITQRRLAA